MEIKLKNGSKIKSTECSGNIRGKRSELIGFYCKYCDCIHIDYPFKNTIIIDNDIFCDKVLEGENNEY